MKCPECGKGHRAGLALEKCRHDASWTLGHYIVRGLKEDDPLMVKARERSECFAKYAAPLEAK